MKNFDFEAMTPFILEVRSKDVKRQSTDEAEGPISADIGQEPSCNLKFSDFVVKPNPFQIYSVNTFSLSSSPASLGSSLSCLMSRNDSQGSLQVDDISNINKDIKNYQFIESNNTKIRSILKTGERSRFYRRDKRSVGF